MREELREFFVGAKSIFTGKLLAGFVLLPIFFTSVGASFPEPLTNIVDESALFTPENIVETEIERPDAGVSTPVMAQKITPVDIATPAPVSFDLMIAGKVSTSVVGVGLDAKGAVAVPGSVAGYYSAGGARLLVGHNDGVFASLRYVGVGEVVTFWGQNYQVTGSKVYNYDPSVGVYNADGTLNANGVFMYESLYGSDLSLMTCHGSYLPAYGTYNQRLVVFTKRI